MRNIGALIVRIGFWGIIYYEFYKEPQNSIGAPSLQRLPGFRGVGVQVGSGVIQ